MSVGLHSFAWSFLTRAQLKQADDAVRMLLWSGGCTGDECQILIRLHWKLQRAMLDRTTVQRADGD